MRTLQVQTTTETEADARNLGGTLVRERLAACAQVVGPIVSSYWWKGELTDAREWLCLLKTTAEAYPALEARLREIHPYEEPEIVAVPLEAGSAGYLRWVRESVVDVDRVRAEPADRPLRAPKRNGISAGNRARR